MTTKQAINLLERISYSQHDAEKREALSMAVRALEGDVDLISRKQVLNASHFVACWDGVEHFSLEVVDADFIQKLPSVQPMQSNAQPTQINTDSTQTNTLDCVSRQAAIDAFVKYVADGYAESPNDFEGYMGIVKKLPSAQPEILACGNGELVKESDDLVKDLVKDCISRKMAIDELDGFRCGTKAAWKAIEDLPSVQPEYEPVTAEDFAKTMSENTIWQFAVWHGGALALMKEQGFVICKKAM